LHEGLHLESVQALEEAVDDGRVAALAGFGPRSADRIRAALAERRRAGTPMLWPHAAALADRLLAAIHAHPDVRQAAVAGALRRRSATVTEVVVVAAVAGTPGVVADALAQRLGAAPPGAGGSATRTVRLPDGVLLTLACVRPAQFVMALWQGTGSEPHVAAVLAHAAARGLQPEGEGWRGPGGARVPVADEAALYGAVGLPAIPPELREGTGELDASADWAGLVTVDALVGALHCHSHDSDGHATLAELAEAARARGLRYLGVSDHSQSNTHAGGLTREAIVRQHGEIDRLNAAWAASGVAFRLLKGIEADILPCGRLDYDAAFLDRFDFVIGSIHARYGMNARQMTDRVLRALDDPHLTVLGHPTGGLRLTREPYALDLEAVAAKAAAVGVALELNADPHRLDLDDRGCRLARAAGALVSIGPDAHSPDGFDHLALGVAMARKGWLAADDVLNTRDADGVLAFARARRG
jgi:DNA polymerase (family 10)